MSASVFDENIAGGSDVATLSTSDPDSGDNHSYALVSGDGDADNSAFTIEGNQLKIVESPDFESKSSYSVRVQTKDSGGLTLEKSFAIYVNDLNEHPSSALASNLSFNWWISGGSLVSSLRAVLIKILEILIHMHLFLEMEILIILCLK